MKWIITAVLATALAGGTMAQDNQAQGIDIPAEAQRLTGHMARELDLTPEQIEQVGEINANYLEKVLNKRALKEGPDGGRDKAAEIEEMTEALKAVLTEDQYAKWQQLQSAARVRTPDGQPIQQVEPIR